MSLSPTSFVPTAMRFIGSATEIISQNAASIGAAVTAASLYSTSASNVGTAAGTASTNAVDHLHDPEQGNQQALEVTDTEQALKVSDTESGNDPYGDESAQAGTPTRTQQNADETTDTGTTAKLRAAKRSAMKKAGWLVALHGAKALFTRFEHAQAQVAINAGAEERAAGRTECDNGSDV
jgi:hypothetical protein